MKDIKTYILESQKSLNKTAIEKVLSNKECPLTNDDFYEQYNLYDYAVIPNIQGFADQFELDYVGKYWALSKSLNVDTESAKLPLDIIPYSYGPDNESIEDFDYYENKWKNATQQEKQKTIQAINKLINK